MGTEFQEVGSDDITGPDLPMNGYSGRTFYYGENAGEGAFLRG